MKINVEVDCTPEEARRFMGLPDLTPVHDAYVANLTETMKNGVSAEMFESMVRNWAPMGEAGMKLWTQLFDQGAKRV
ncbi:hypothetical protein GGR88_002466 [Sphingomonas jejuensis]|uniref:Uncharacterized protein n=1 Tax=Sphingomonas jejuensis TaxID=904715 RepID=A0ABX0XQG3_9SPHN|nr:DUF6489 family protein [Sphingomonas jejuensis]NJC34952.1 hypothetical protein [Sphingomonas jejuensis]